MRALSKEMLENTFKKHRIIETFCRIMVTQTMISLDQ